MKLTVSFGKPGCGQVWDDGSPTYEYVVADAVEAAAILRDRQRFSEEEASRIGQGEAYYRNLNGSVTGIAVLKK